MLFNSLTFFVLLLITFLIYYSKPLRYFQVPVLIAASFIFYAYQNPYLLILLLFSVGINIFFSFQVAISASKGRRQLLAMSGVILNLTILGIFKYSNLIARAFFPRSWEIHEFLLHIPLPIGISFFTFQGISLVVDTFKYDKVENYQSLIPKNLKDYSKKVTLFIAFFPQLVAGPIVKAHDFIPQIKPKFMKDIDWDFVSKHLILGFFLKSFIADNLKNYTNFIGYPFFFSLSTTNLLVGLFGFSMEIFADFAGYSAIAIGTAAIFGFHLKENFMFPYISTSFSEFWRRWHISLSSFLKEYLYITLGGNRRGKFRTYFNLMLTMILGGLWHGAALAFAIWGTFHGLALAIERLTRDIFGKPNSKNIFFQVFHGLKVFLGVSIAWILFKLSNFPLTIQFFQILWINTSLPINYNDITYIGVYSLPIILYHFWYLWRQTKYPTWLYRYDFIMYAFLLFLTIMGSGTSQAFIYFQF